QVYTRIRADCLRLRRLFTDDLFPPEATSLGYAELGAGSKLARAVVWSRPEEICKNPQFIVDDASRFDLCQGEVGDCWFLAALASVTLHPRLLERVLPSQQSFSAVDGYAGIFRFRVRSVSKYLEVSRGAEVATAEALKQAASQPCPSATSSCCLAARSTGGLYCCCCCSTGGFYCCCGTGRSWLEKGALGAFCPAALGLCCGGVPSGLSFPKRPEVETKDGIVLGHAYSVTGVEKVIYRGQSVELVRLRNPWGCVEWSGDWSDRAPQWNEVDPRVMQRMRNALEDGEFWMYMGHFRKNFHTLDMCHLTADDLAEGQRHRWAVATHAGEWRRGHSAGGTCQYQDTYRTNPQYRVRILAREGGEVLLTLLQKPRDMQRNRQPLLSIGFLIHQIPKNKAATTLHLPQEALTAASSVGGTATWSNLREVGGRFHLPYGDYVVVPCTFQPNDEAEFILRIFAQR
uniref:Calpain 8 n=1 Tax=Petromyzon marinus TaxID=7757 RepID=S4R9N5_PETMA